MVPMDDETKKRQSGLGFAVGFVLLVLLGFVLTRTLLVQSFHIPSESMESTLLVGDFLFVSKYPYGYSRYSLPFSLPLFSGRVFGGLPARGDIVVFVLPRDDSQVLIKRIVGLPGDRVQMIGGALHLNGDPVQRSQLDDLLDHRPIPGNTIRIRRWRETLPNGPSYTTLDQFDQGPIDDTPLYIVPPGHYFVMGDNRDNSTDSRVLDAVGYIPLQNIVGRAEIIYFSISDGAAIWQVWRWPGALRFARFFSFIR
jgi:signal peptidase I